MWVSGCGRGGSAVVQRRGTYAVAVGVHRGQKTHHVLCWLDAGVPSPWCRCVCVQHFLSVRCGGEGAARLTWAALLPRTAESGFHKCSNHCQARACCCCSAVCQGRVAGRRRGALQEHLPSTTVCGATRWRTAEGAQRRRGEPNRRYTAGGVHQYWCGGARSLSQFSLAVHTRTVRVLPLHAT